MSTAESWLTELTQMVPLDIFVVSGAFIEEIIAPIPSPLVMTLGGSIALAQGRSMMYLLWLALIGSVGKTIASIVVYFIADKGEDLVVGRFGHLLGVSNKEVESIGKYFNGGKRDTALLFLARALPIMPTAVVSIVCGVIKVNIKSYTLGTFLGTLVRSLFYLLLGYLGLSSAESIISGLDSVEQFIQIIIAGVGLAVLALLYFRRSKETDIMGLIKKWFRLK